MTKIEEKWDEIGDNPLIIIDELYRVWNSLWNIEVAEFMQDEDFGAVLDMAIRMLSGEVPEQSKIAFVLVKLEAYAIKFRVMYSAYMGFMKGTQEANQKKNMYKELYTGIDRLVDALKYMVK
jgi:hypothetical protein